MANSIITKAGIALIAKAMAEKKTIEIDRMIFADIPALDVSQTPNPEQVLPPEVNIVLNAEISKSALVDADTIVYSKVLGAEDGNYYINWIGLYSSVEKVLIAVSYVPRHRKYKTDGFQTGNTLYKNFSVQFANAAELTKITVPPETWQFDFDSRYALKDHTHPEFSEGDDMFFEPMGNTTIDPGGGGGGGGCNECMSFEPMENTTIDPGGGGGGGGCNECMSFEPMDNTTIEPGVGGGNGLTWDVIS